MDFNNHDFVMRVLLFAEFLILSLICCLCLILFKGNTLLIFLLINGMAIAFIYSLLRYHQSRRARRSVKDISIALKAMTEDLDKNILPLSPNETLSEVYDEIESLRKHFLRREKNRQDIISIVNSVAVNMELGKLLHDLMPKLLDATGSNCGVFYLSNNITNKLEIKHSVGFSKNIYGEFDMALGEGLVNIDGVNNEIKIIRDIPEDTVYYIRAFLGKIKPRNLMSVPIVNREQLVGVFLFASIYDYGSEQLDMVNLIKYYVGAAVDNSLTYEKSKRLSNELKFQNRLIQNLNEDLEKNVRDRTLFLNDIVDSIKDYAIYAIDKTGDVLAWNKGAEKIFGFSFDEVIGKNIELIYTEEEILTGKLKKRLEEAEKEGKRVETGWRTRKDGSRYYAEMTVFGRYDARGKIIGFTIVSKDITALKNIENSFWFERQFSSLLLKECSRSLLFTNDVGEIQLASDAAMETLGTESLVGRKISSFFEHSEEFDSMLHDLDISETHVTWQFKIKGSDVFTEIAVNVFVNAEDNIHRLFFHLK